MAKKTRILFALLLVLVMVFTAACTGKDADSDDSDSKSDKGSSALRDKFGKDNEAETTAPVEEDQPQEQLSIEGTVLFDQDGVKVTVTGLETSNYGPELTLLVENDTDKDVKVSTDRLSVNGYMLNDPLLYTVVPAGEQVEDSLQFSFNELKKCGIKELSKLEFHLDIGDPNTYEFIAMSELLTLNLTAQCNQKIDDSGKELYNANGIRVIYRGVEESDLFDGTVEFFVENNSGQDVSIYAKDISINGVTCDESLWTDLRDGTVALDYMILWDLSKVNLESIDQIENIELKFRVIDFESWQEIDESDPITIEN